MFPSEEDNTGDARKQVPRQDVCGALLLYSRAILTLEWSLAAADSLDEEDDPGGGEGQHELDEGQHDVVVVDGVPLHVRPVAERT